VATPERPLRRSTLQRFQRYVAHRLGLEGYLERPGDGRVRPQIPARHLLWGLLIGQVLRVSSHHAVEALIRSPARGALGLRGSFGDDALAYFSERLDPERTRMALAGALRRAKRNKAFDGARWIGLALDGSGAGHSVESHCALCHPVRNAECQVIGHLHHGVVVCVVADGLTLPCDGEPYPAGESEYGAGQRLLARVVAHLGPRFADYVVVDGGFATAPFLHTAGDLGLWVVARLKDNLPLLAAAARARFEPQPAQQTIEQGGDRVELWDADDFDPWETLRWPTVRVLRYRQHKPDGRVFEAYWLTDVPVAQVGPRALYGIAKGRWAIENQGFNDAKNRYGLEHIPHHHANSVVIHWLVVLLALTLERLFRLRHLHRGTHRPHSAIELLWTFRLDLATPAVHDTS
jgi:hypothetical protein